MYEYFKPVVSINNTLNNNVPYQAKIYLNKEEIFVSIVYYETTYKLHSNDRLPPMNESDLLTFYELLNEGLAIVKDLNSKV